MDTKTQKAVAIKIMNVDAGSDVIENVQSELAVLSRCQHHCIVGFLGCFIEESRLWVIMDYCGGGSIRQLVRCF